MSERPYEERPAARPSSPQPEPEPIQYDLATGRPLNRDTNKKRRSGWTSTIVIAVIVAVLWLIVLNMNNKPEVSEACDQALSTAANTEDFDNDAELFASLDACQSADEWVQALIQNPSAGILTSYNEKEGRDFLTTVCVRAVGTPTCLDAIEKGYTDFQLDNPDLPALQKYGTGVPPQD